MMRFALGLLTFLLGVLTLDAKSLWSGGVEWGTAVTARAAAYWQDDGTTPTGKAFVDVAIAGELLTSQTRSATWNLGISGILDDISPNTASASFVGQVTAVPGDDFVISSGWGVQWAGRVDTISDTTDVNGDHWTTVTATDRIGALGAVQLTNKAVTAGTVLDGIIEYQAAKAGLAIEVTDDSASGLATVQSGVTETTAGTSSAQNYDGDLLGFISMVAKASNAVMALQRDGTISVIVRESVTPSSVATLSGDDAPASWTAETSIDVDINRWYAVNTGGGGYTIYTLGEDLADVLIYGERAFDATDIQMNSLAQFDDWIAYGGSQRPVVTGEFVVKDFSQDELLLLDPFDWVTYSGTDWQIMSLSWTAGAPGEPLRVTITADNLLDLI